MRRRVQNKFHRAAAVPHFVCDAHRDFKFGGWAEVTHGSWSLLVWRITYEEFASLWPNRPQPNLFSEALGNAEKFVASTTLAEPLPWRNSTLLRDPPTFVRLFR